MKMIIALAAAAMLLAGCSASGAKEEETLRISAAASLMDAIGELEPAFRESHPDTELVINYGSSTKLRAQIEQGAPFDLFLSASHADMEKAAEGGYIDTDTVVPFAENRLVLVSAHTVDGEVTDLLGSPEGNIAVGQPDSVPLGIYTKESLAAAGLWDGLDGHLVYGKDARQVLTYAESGNADLGIIYQSDAAISEDVEVVGELPASGTPIIYPAGIAEQAENPAAAEAFLELLTGDEGRQVIRDYGFALPEDGK
ncbi:Molybdate-binding periplasmic protein precursor [Bhargavaea cecembensis DSE10]|uniref:Molybdate-binding periplasmic protein n=1 Tax=Bhargavaea cecembensis DSE10 TaxID=1235279 RepID=M7NUG9_9BACL|nr:molybdate ABC transporter substrate-binding protein [Bhargavaea cecembensis]EMR05285.1 Molybdate-binding periplasmic protein precursor [Bhargavaea cecembensis DSE10]